MLLFKGVQECKIKKQLGSVRAGKEEVFGGLCAFVMRAPS